MGYTHYWTFKKIGKASDLEAKYKKALLECAKVARAYYVEFGGLSGYSAHTKPGAYGGLHFNGKGDEGHEDFSMREHFSQNLEQSFNFCKTAQKPYDLAVIACLAILKHRLGAAIEVSSDGTRLDWSAGIDYAQKITKLKIKNPIPKPADFDLECPYCGRSLNIDRNACCGEAGHGVRL